jgi:hypothetical protein
VHLGSSRYNAPHNRTNAVDLLLLCTVAPSKYAIVFSSRGTLYDVQQQNCAKGVYINLQHRTGPLHVTSTIHISASFAQETPARCSRFSLVFSSLAFPAIVTFELQVPVRRAVVYPSSRIMIYIPNARAKMLNSCV